ncbi:MAG: carboxymuconolactone decarboxylase family protein [Spirochaetia bacterium]
MSYIQPPARIPFLYRMMLFLVEKRLGRQLLANRILTWYPKALIGSGVMEGLIAHDTPEVPRRLLALVRIYTSFLVSCAFCIDLNSKDFQRKGLSDQEILALQGRVPMDEVVTLGEKERAALRYVQCMCSTPLAFPANVVEKLKEHFSERGIVIIASTCAQVNFWARLIQGLGVPPAGFSESCPILHLDSYTTAKK